MGKAQTRGSKVLIIFLFLSLLAGTGMYSKLSTQFILFDRSTVFNTNEFSITNRLLVQQTNESSTGQCLPSVGWVSVIFPPWGIQKATCKEWPKETARKLYFSEALILQSCVTYLLYFTENRLCLKYSCVPYCLAFDNFFLSLVSSSKKNNDNPSMNIYGASTDMLGMLYKENSFCPSEQ